MKKLFTALTLLIVCFTTIKAQNLFEGATVHTLGEPKTWTRTYDPQTEYTGDDEELKQLPVQNFTYSFNSDNLKKILNTENNDNIILFPELLDGTIFNTIRGWDTDYNKKTIGIQGFYLELPETTEIGIIDTRWEGATASFDIYVSNETPTVASPGELVYEGSPIGQVKEHRAVLNQIAKGKYFTLIPKEAFNWGWGVKIRSIAGNILNDKVDHITIEDIKTVEGNNVNLKVLLYNSANVLLNDYDSIKDLTLTSSENENVSIIKSDENGNFTLNAINPGVYTLTATAVLNDESSQILSAESSLTVTLDWTKRHNIAMGKAIMARYKEIKNDLDEIQSDDHPYEYATDGDIESYYEYSGNWGGGDSWVLIDLSNEYQIDAVETLMGANSNGKYQIAFGSANALIPTEDEIDSIFKQNMEGWNYTDVFNRNANDITSNLFPEIVKARYVVLIDKDNPGGKPQYKEIYIEGTEYLTKLDKIEITNTIPNLANNSPQNCDMFIGESADLSFVYKDQYGVVIEIEDSPSLSIQGAGTLDGTKLTATEAGIITITATLNDITVERNIMVIDAALYCMDNATFISDSEDDTTKINDGGYKPNEKGGQFILAPNSPQGPEDHYIIADLGNTYDLSMIIAIWEGAAPRDYNVYVGNDKDNLTLAYTVSGHTQQDWYDRLSRENMNNVRFIKIETIYNATGYGLKLYELKAYGTESAWDNVPADTDTDHQYSAKNVFPIFSNVYGKTDLPEFEGNGTLSLIATTTAKSGKAEKKSIQTLDDDADTDDSTDTYKVILFQNMDIEQSTTISVNEDVRGAESFVIDIYSKTAGTIIMTANWEYGSVSYSTKYDIEISEADIEKMANGEYKKVDEAASVIGYMKDNLTTIKSLSFTSTIPSFVIDNCYFAGSSPLEVDSVNAENNDCVNVFNLQGICVKNGVKADEALQDLPAGIYIVNGKKIIK